MPPCGGREQALAAAVDLAFAAEEHVGVLHLVGLEPAERRAAFVDAPNYFPAEQPLLVEPGAQMVFKQVLELIRPPEGLEAGAEVALARDEPLPPECLEGIELRIHQAALTGVGHRNPGFGDLAVDDDVGDVLVPLGLERAHQLVDGAAGIGTSVRHGAEQIGGEFGAELRPQNADDEIGRAGVRDLLLEALVGGVILLLLLEEDRLDLHVFAETAVQAIDDARRAFALRHHVGR